MSSLSRQSASPLLSEGTEEFNSDSFWTDCFALQQDSLFLFGGLPTTLNDSPTIPIDDFPSFEDDYPKPPPVLPEDFERVNCVDAATIGYNVPFGIQPEDLYVMLSLQSPATANP